MVNKIILYASILFLLFSCKAKVPEDVLDKETMENLLYDYHLAQALAKKSGDSVDYRTRLYTEAVFQKYGINEDKFNHTMEWYSRNSEELFKIYKKIDDKFAAATSSGKNQGNPYAQMKAEGDTMNVWRASNFYMLASTWRNRMEFEIPGDSTYEKGDRLMWQFNTRWFYREGQKTAMAQLAIVYENDSVDSRSQTLYSTGMQDLYLNVGSKPVKSVRGFVYLMSEWTAQPRILTISDPVLVRFKKKKPKVLTDSTSVSLKNDSLSVDSSKLTVKDTPRINESRGDVERRRIDRLNPKASREASENTRILSMPREVKIN